jgi:hypothetical protein
LHSKLVRRKRKKNIKEKSRYVWQSKNLHTLYLEKNPRREEGFIKNLRIKTRRDRRNKLDTKVKAND